MANGAKLGTNADNDFREFQERYGGFDSVIVRNLKTLDYEKTAEYNLTLTATVSWRQCALHECSHCYCHVLAGYAHRCLVRQDRTSDAQGCKRRGASL